MKSFTKSPAGLPKRDECVGCGACVDGCPKNAIDMVPDHEGFLQVCVHSDRCIDCGKCLRLCPTRGKKIPKRSDSPTTLAAWNTEEESRLAGTSGGVFPALAETVFARGGSVGGAVYAEDLSVHQTVCDDPESLTELRRSKYVQSDARGFYHAVGQRLHAGREVLVCATPCQIAALYQFLGETPENLTTCDFICLGVNSPKVYRRYLDYLESRHGAKVTRIAFKDKSFGWHSFATKAEFDDGTVYCQDRYHDLFMLGYLKPNHFGRPCCYDCQFKGLPRPGDLTLADFWGINKIDPLLDNNQGTSMVLINSPRGAALLDAAGERLFRKECRFADVLPGNVALFHSMKKRSGREKFYQDLDRLPFDRLLTAHAPKIPWKSRLKRGLKRILSRFLFKRKGGGL